MKNGILIMSSKDEDYGKKYYWGHKEDRLEASRQWRNNHPDYGRKYYQDNKEDQNRKKREHYQENREEILKEAREYREEVAKLKKGLLYILGHKCELCPENEMLVLEFHHINPKKKLKPIKKTPLERYRTYFKEIYNLAVLCPTCHKKVHLKILSLSHSLVARTWLDFSRVSTSG